MSQGRYRRGGKGRKQQAKQPFAGPVSVTIESIGGGGDGLATHQGHRLYVPMTLPSEVVSVQIASKKGDGWFCDLLAIEKPSPDRVTTMPCPHFADCGGCSLQHMPLSVYQDFKRDRLLTALARRGISDVPLSEAVFIPSGTRRRVTLSITRDKGRLAFGFQSKGSHQVIDINACPVLHPVLESMIGPLRQHLVPLLGKMGNRMQVLLQLLDDDLIDLVITGGQEPEGEMRIALAALATDLDLPRLSWRAEAGDEPDIVVNRKPLSLTFGPEAVSVPPGAFMQPSTEGQGALVSWVMSWLSGAKRVVDLYAGLGTFALPLSTHSRIHAIDVQADQIDALHRAGGRLSVENRDLDRQPLTKEALKKFDGLVFDPPRKGADFQCQMIAKGAGVDQAPKRIVAVSCNPDTFARDARILLDAGYALKDLKLLDQFIWSPHVELAAYFQRP